MSDEQTQFGSVAEEIAALTEALRARRPRPGSVSGAASEDPPAEDADAPAHAPGIDTCGICPVCRLIESLHTVSPAAVMAMADLAHQAEVTLRALALDLKSREPESTPPTREDIPVDDFTGDDFTGDDITVDDTTAEEFSDV